MPLRRLAQNPLIRPEDIQPWRDGFEVLSVFNPAVVECNGEIILLIRVAERPEPRPGVVRVAMLDAEHDNGHVHIEEFSPGDAAVDCDDPRILRHDGQTYLTSMSYLLLARSRDGIHFDISDQPFLMPETPEEEYGIEDARISCIDGVYYITYAAVSRRGVATALARTRDFCRVERLGIIFPPMNKDVVLFPEKIDGCYVALHRPDTDPYTRPAMWLASSPDLVNWGQHRFLMAPRPGKWDGGRIGAGTAPLKTSQGWVEIYHGADQQDVYRLGVLLLAPDDPGRIIYRAEKPLLAPQAEYELEGFFSNVVFTNGMATFPGREDELVLYYGAADKYICAVRLTMEDLLESCSV